MISWRTRLALRTIVSRVKDLRGSFATSARYERRGCLSWQISEDVLEVELHHAPCNEIGLEMLADLEALASFIEQGAGGAKAILIYSSRPKGFSAGADLKSLYSGLIERKQKSSLRLKQKWEIAGDVKAFIDRIHDVLNTIDMSPIPTVGALHGFVFGGGFELALTCDVLVAEQSTRFAFPELRLGLIPGFGGIPRLRRDVGNAAIRDLLFTGRSLNAKRAHELGLISQVVPRGKGLQAARSVAKQITLFDSATCSLAKDFTKELPLKELEEEKLRFIEMLGSPAVEEALKTFVNSQSIRPYLAEKPSAEVQSDQASGPSATRAKPTSINTKSNKELN